MRWIWEGCRNVGCEAGFDLPDLETFRADGLFECPEHYQSKTLFKDLVDDPKANPIGTASGKIELSDAVIGRHPKWEAPVEWLGAAAADQLHLISPQPVARLHAQLDNGSASKNSKVRGREPCYIHRRTGVGLGISDGDLVLLENDRGACLAGAVLSDDMRPDCVALATGSSFDPQMVNGRRMCVHGNPNVLTRDMGASDISQGNIAHTCLVKVSKWAGAEPEIKAFGQPRFVEK